MIPRPIDDLLDLLAQTGEVLRESSMMVVKIIILVFRTLPDIASFKEALFHEPQCTHFQAILSI